MAEPQGKLPNVLTPTADLSREEWLAYRRQGIGGSDAAAVLGISPFRTGVNLYYDKLGQPVEDDEQNWVAKEVGTLLEDLVARIFAKKTGLEVCPMPVMFQHPDHPWMLADVDRLVKLADGSTAILECKTTNYNARDKWEYDGKPIVPQYYEAQGRHYMAVMNLNRVYFCCLYGNSEDDVVIRSIDRDLKYEDVLNQQDSDRGQVNKGKKRSIQLVIPCGNPAKPFELLEEALNQMALFIQPPIYRPRLRNIALWRDHIAGALF